MVRQFNFEKTEFPEVIRITPFSASDDRGGLVKDYIESRQGVLRGLHFQRVRQQPKLIRCLKGSVWSTVVDIRKESPLFGRWISEELSEDNNLELLVPAGFAFGTLAMGDSLLSCICGERFYAEYDSGIRWDDPDIAVRWPLSRGQKPILSEKDKTLQFLKEYRESV